jgi:hypothetical protein
MNEKIVQKAKKYKDLTQHTLDMIMAKNENTLTKEVVLELIEHAFIDGADWVYSNMNIRGNL